MEDITKDKFLKEDIQKNINEFLKKYSDTKEKIPIEIIIPFLKEINKYFIKNYEIHIDKNLIIRPIETEIYFSRFSSENPIKDDGMCHINELQKKRFGQLYFHRKGISKDNKILCANSKTTWGGVDVCLSDSQDYCLSILIRSAFINGTTELVSGTRNICDKIKENCFDNKDSLQSFFKNLEKNEDNKVKIFKRNDDEQSHIFSQPRISGKKYYGKTKDYELNCLNLGKYLPNENNYEYLKKIKISYSIYTETKKQEIIEKYHQTKNY